MPQTRVKYASEIAKPYLSNKVALIALGGLQEVGGSCAPVSSKVTHLNLCMLSVRPSQSKSRVSLNNNNIL